MSVASPSSRHCYVRMPASFKTKKEEIQVTLQYVGHNEFYAIAISNDAASRLRPGERGVFEFALVRQGEKLEVPAHVAWLNKQARDSRGELAIGIGLGAIRPSAEVTRRLVGFMDGFRPTVLAVDDEEDNLELVYRALRSEYRVLVAENVASALDVLANEQVAVVLTDQRLPDGLGTDLVATMLEYYPEGHTQCVLCTGFPESLGVESVLTARFFSYLEKPVNEGELRKAIDEANRSYDTEMTRDQRSEGLRRTNERLQRENELLRQRLVGTKGFESIVGESHALRDALEELQKVIRTDITVFLHGETGTGKELIARAIHGNGPRSTKPYLAQNCAGLTDSLLQSLLFGHIKGAFTGATQDRRGLFQEAHQGTLFLDEVAELSPAAQASLLRAVQEGEVTPVGSTHPEKVDVRIISATHRDLREEMQAGRFREDLFFRLGVMTVNIPPLRERHGDVPLLARFLLQRACLRYDVPVPLMEDAVVRALEGYAWPGNIRELDNEMSRLAVLAQGTDCLDISMVSEQIGARPTQSGAGVTDGLTVPWGLSYDETITRVSTMVVERAMRDADGVIRKAAELLDMDRSRLAKLRRRLQEDT